VSVNIILVYLQNTTSFDGNYLSMSPYSIIWSHPYFGSQLGFANQISAPSVKYPGTPLKDQWYACFVTYSNINRYANLYVNSSKSCGSNLFPLTIPYLSTTYLGANQFGFQNANISIVELTTYDFDLSPAEITIELQCLTSSYGITLVCPPYDLTAAGRKLS
jgi:hypothetical protein